jgi:hypothetical protein
MSIEKSKNKYGCLYFIIFIIVCLTLFTASPFYEKVGDSDYLTNSSSLLSMIFFAGIVFIGWKLFKNTDED